MKNKHFHITPHRIIRWYRCPPLIFILVFVSLCAWFVLSMSAIREMDLQPTHLTLRGDRCAYLRAKRIQITPVGPKAWCSLIVPFRENAIAGGGIIRNGDGEIRVADDEIIEEGATVDQPWTPEQTRSVILACISTIVMLGLFTWMLILTS